MARFRLAVAVLVAVAGASIAVALIVAQPRPASLTQSRSSLTANVQASVSVQSRSKGGTAKTSLNRPAGAVTPNGSWTVYHHDDAHTGYDPTLSTVAGATTGWVSPTLDQTTYTEPLVYQGIVYVATSNNTVYALNQTDGTVLWSHHFGAPQTSGWQCGNINPTGILGTGVIDAANSRIYVVAFLSQFLSYYLYGLDLVTGTVMQSAQIYPAGFDWTIQQQRGALALSHDGSHVYVPFGGRAGDCGPYHGWVVGMPTAGGLGDELYETPSTASGIWAAGGVIVDDSTGNVFFATGNAIPCSGAVNSDSVIRTTSALASPTFFQPLDWYANWCGPDLDLGSASPVLLSPNLMFAAGKYGQGFLLDPSNLGGLNGQLFPARSPYVGADVCRGIRDSVFGSFAYAAPYVYLQCSGGGLVGLQVNTSTPSFTVCSGSCPSPDWIAGGSTTFGAPIVAGGAVWVVDIGGSGLWGFDAATGSQIYHSGGFGVDHFSTPTEAGGQIFVAADTVVRSFNLVIGCSSMSAAAVPSTSANAGTAVTITGTASGAGCTAPLYEFWMKPPSGVWSLVQNYTSSINFHWNTTGWPLGPYLFSVWARNTGSTRSYDAFATVAYTLTSAPCTGMSASSSPPVTATIGSPVSLTGSATGCPNAQYEFWIKPPSGVWSLAQAYSGSATLNWNTTGKPAGSYLFSVWARDTSSPGTSGTAPNTYDAFSSVPYTLTTCSSVTTSSAPLSTANIGTPVTISGTAAGCPSPLYEFWMKSPNGVWALAQGYTASPSLNWNTSGRPAGSYLFSIWARDTNSAGAAGSPPYTYDAFGTVSYLLTTAPCTGMSASAAPPTSTTAGTTVVFTGAATGCPNAMYEFWVKSPSGVWSLARGYSSSAAFSWVTTGKPTGSYLISVWARDASSSGTSGAAPNTYDAFTPLPYALT